MYKKSDHSSQTYTESVGYLTSDMMLGSSDCDTEKKKTLYWLN